MGLPLDKKARKERPIARGVLDYFPDAIAAVANVSYIGNQQHNPGEEMHWAREKSRDHADCMARHLIERGTIDDDGLLHSAKAAWRALALLQLELEDDQKARGNDNCRDGRSIYEQRNGIQAGANGMAVAPVEETVNKSPGRHAYDHDPMQDVYTLNVNPDAEPTGDYEYDEAVKLAIPQDSAWQPKSNKDADHTDFCRGLMYRSLLRLDAPVLVAKHISQGTVFAPSNGIEQRYVYVAGPMRGHERFNFPAFDAARDELVYDGWNVVSPADIDRADGSDTSKPQSVYIHRDFFALYFIATETVGGAIAMLPGWEKSTGAVAEFFLARWLGLTVLNAMTAEPLGYDDLRLDLLVGSLCEFLRGQK